MNFLRIIAAFLLFAMFSGCKKEAVDVSPDMSGAWESGMNTTSPYNSGIDLMISSGRNSEWINYAENKIISATRGKAKIKEDHFQLKKIDLHIDEYPHYDTTGNYVMVLQGQKFFGALFPYQYTVRISNDSALFSWYFGGEDEANMVIEYKTVSSPGWTTAQFSRKENWDLMTNLSHAVITGLSPATTYQWRMKSVNGSHDSQYTPVQTFLTP